MLSARFFIVVAVVMFMFTAGMRHMSLPYVLPWAMLAFILSWVLRPMAELRHALSVFQEKILRREKAEVSDVLMATLIVLVTWLLVPVTAYGLGYILSLIWRMIGL